MIQHKKNYGNEQRRQKFRVKSTKLSSRKQNTTYLKLKDFEKCINLKIYVHIINIKI